MKNFFRKIISAITAFLAVASSLCISPAFAEITPNPVISRNCPAYSGTGDAKSANDEHYFSFCSVNAPDYLAYDLSAVPDEQKKQVIAVWYNTSAFDNIGMYANSNMLPSDYTIEVNSAEGGEYPSNGWEIVETVEGNTLASRQHLVNMEGYNWIRLNISKADGQEGKNASINFDIHNVSDGISDSWLFLGDSITAGGMNNCYGTGFATHINQIDDKYFPIQENGGIGGIRSIDGRENIDRWLALSQAKYVSIAYGTNDCWGNPNATQEYYENTKYMIDAIISAGKIPVLPKIPASTNDDVKDNVPLYNQMIDKLYNDYGSQIVQGPNFEEFFTENPDLLSGDGVHPADTGYAEMRKLWAETMYERVYSVVNETPVTKDSFGDVNEDGVVDIKDASLIVREYAIIATGGNSILTEAQRINADINKDSRVDTRDFSMILSYYTARLNGETCSFRSYLSKNHSSLGITGDGLDGAPYSNDPTGGFSEAEIESSEYKPKFVLSAEPTDKGIINLSVDISGASKLWSMLGVTIDFDEKLEPVFTSYGSLDVNIGSAIKYLSFNIDCNKDKNQIAVSAMGNSNHGLDGNIITIPFRISEQADGENEYKFSISYKGGEVFTDIDNSEKARLMQAYLFTKGLASTSVTVKNESAVSGITGDANEDGVVDVADAAAIIQSLGNKDKYALSEQGAKNADVYNPGDGITGMDALTIQKLKAGLIKSLPVNE